MKKTTKSETKKFQVHIYLKSESEKIKLKKQATKLGMNVSQYIRTKLLHTTA